MCNNNGECECNKEDGVSFFGEHCEIKLKDECRNITAPSVTGGKSIWSAESIEDGVFEEYSRPVYTYMEGLSPEEAPEEGDSIALVFSGSRYVIMYMSQGNNNAASAYYDWQAKNFHGFWCVLRFLSLVVLISFMLTANLLSVYEGLKHLDLLGLFSFRNRQGVIHLLVWTSSG